MILRRLSGEAFYCARCNGLFSFLIFVRIYVDCDFEDINSSMISLLQRHSSWSTSLHYVQGVNLNPFCLSKSSHKAIKEIFFVYTVRPLFFFRSAYLI